MSLPKPTIVIFDMDGTTVRHLNPRLLGMMEWLDDTAFKTSRLWMWLFERKAQGPILLPAPDEDIKPPKSIIVHKAIHKLRRKDVELLVEPCPGIYSVLALLKKHDIPMALVSNGLGKGYGQDIVQRFGLGSYFPITIFREDIKKSKPHPEPLLLALQNLNVTPDANDVIWYIGDRHKDVTAAHNAQKHIKPATIIPIAYAVNAAVAVIEKGYGPDHIMMSYRDIYAVLNKLLNAAPKDRPPANHEP
ncbi:MAG: HAD family hydrolase [Bdellovibrionales bacterium]